MKNEAFLIAAFGSSMFIGGLLTGYTIRAHNERPCAECSRAPCVSPLLEGTGSSGDPLHLRGEHLKKGDRVVVTSGEYAGRHGTVSFTYADNADYAKWYGIEPGQLRVALDGEAGQGSQGGRGGVPINVTPMDLKPE